jgi:formate-dependent nitrite reductase membrane component NrfD
MAQHFVAPPQWEWYIVWYFFLGGLAGGVYVLGTILRLLGDPRDARVARLAFLVALPALMICPILLTLDLGLPLRFWHMLVDKTTWLPTLKYWSPMSVGAWVLMIFSAFAFVSFLEAVLGEERFRWLRGTFGRLFMVVGSFWGLFLAGYTGVLLTVSNQPIWSDTWALGALFLASGLSVAAATLILLARVWPSAPTTETKLSRADRYFIVLELVLLAIFFISLGAMGARFLEARWLVLWALVLVGTLLPLALPRSAHSGRAAVLAACLVLVGGFALRIVVIFAAQA